MEKNKKRSIPINQLYHAYQIPPNLQEHMYRVASIITLLLDKGLKEHVQKPHDLITIGLLHDMGNIVKFRFDHGTHLLGSEEPRLDYWQSIQNAYQKRYGHNEYQATGNILRELGVDKAVIDTTQTSFYTTMYTIEKASWEQKIFLYADMRVAPHGVVSLAERLSDIFERYASYYRGKKAQQTFTLHTAHLLEKEIVGVVNIKAPNINDVTIQPYCRKLQEYPVIVQKLPKLQW